MSQECIWYKDSKCSLGHFGGDPTEDDCAECKHYAGPNRGAGDVVHNVMKRTGVAKVVEKFSEATGGDCGCGKRRAKLNNIMPSKGASDAAGNHREE